MDLSFSNIIRGSHLAQVTDHHSVCSFTHHDGKQLDQEWAAGGLQSQNLGFEPNVTP